MEGGVERQTQEGLKIPVYHQGKISLVPSRSESYTESRTLRTESGRKSREADSRRFEDTSLSPR